MSVSMLLFPYTSPSPRVHKSILYVCFSITAGCNGPRRRWPRGTTPHPRSGVAGGRSYPTSEIRGGSRGRQAATVQEWLRGGTPRPRLGGRPGGATPRLRSGASPEEQPHVQGAVAALGAGALRGATPCSRSGGAAVNRYPTSKVREAQVRQ